MHILKNFRYHSSEWKETNPEEDWTVVSEEAPAEATKKKITSLYIYEKWWCSSAVCIFYNFNFY